MDKPTLLKQFSVEFDSGIPAYRQIINSICVLVNRNFLKEGDQLPTIRELTETLGLNPNTVAKAFHELELKGIISGRRGCGSYIARKPESQEMDEKQRREKLDSLYSEMLSEAGRLGISEREVKEYINNRGVEKWRD